MQCSHPSTATSSLFALFAPLFGTVKTPFSSQSQPLCHLICIQYLPKRKCKSSQAGLMLGLICARTCILHLRHAPSIFHVPNLSNSTLFIKSRSTHQPSLITPIECASRSSVAAAVRHDSTDYYSSNALVAQDVTQIRVDECIVGVLPHHARLVRAWRELEVRYFGCVKLGSVGECVR